MSFYKDTNRTKDGRKKRQEEVNISEDQDNFFKKTGRDHVGRKKRKGV